MPRRDPDSHPFGPAVATLIDEFNRLPGIGKKSAERLAYHILKVSKEDAMGLAEAIETVKTSIRRCEVCFNVSEKEVCPLCSNPSRSRTTVCVVEQPSDVTVIESTGAYDGTYHVLGGRISPLEGVGPEDLTIDQLVRRVKDDAVTEIIMATNPTLEGDGTALYLSNVLGSNVVGSNVVGAVDPVNGEADAASVRITRLARGIATGSVLEFANKEMLADAMRGRQTF